ncbi:hypothetical protein F2Q68_00014512 [Brassica cretica]|uniref:Uncharacterized protein n=1 Tax=Brassica cretica TaxID=69181 RepID=A0A8S9HE93_BRACR|nr:hypothetical protein F2Q68_00014512 [Brassica cretica]
MGHAGTTTRDAVPARVISRCNDTTTRGGATWVSLLALSKRIYPWVTRGRRRGMLYPLA